MQKTRILLTAFEPFGGESINPALEIVRAIEPPSGVELHTLVVPVTFSGAARPVLAELDACDYDAVVMLGQAGGRSAITVERVAINIDDASIPDNAGDQPADRPILPEGPAAHFATLPIRRMIEAIQRAGVAASISNSAGTIVCNHLMYSVLHHLSGTPVRTGFIHVPWLPEQAQNRPGAPSMPLSQMLTGIAAALSALLPEQSANDLG